MKRVLAFCAALTLAVPVMAFAQGKADFSGTWTLDEAKSDPAPAGRGGGGGGGGGGGRGGGGTASKLVIKQAGGNLTVDRTLANGADTLVFKLDGSESVNKMGQSEAKSKTTWEGNNLVITTQQQLQTPNGTFDITQKDVYNVQGGVLTVTTTRTTARGDTTRKLVYNKG
jgi:hypothetical protein